MFEKTERMLQLEALPENAGNDILFIIEKDYFQRLGEEYPSAVYYAEDEEELAEAKADFEWGNDGKPTGIESDEEFEAIQRQIWGELIYFLNKKKPAREKWNRHDLKKAFH